MNPLNYRLMWLTTAWWVANTANPSQMWQFVASDLGLHCSCLSVWILRVKIVLVKVQCCMTRKNNRTRVRLSFWYCSFVGKNQTNNKKTTKKNTHWKQHGFNEKWMDSTQKESTLIWKFLHSFSKGGQQKRPWFPGKWTPFRNFSDSRNFS